MVRVNMERYIHVLGTHGELSSLKFSNPISTEICVSHMVLVIRMGLITGCYIGIGNASFFYSTLGVRSCYGRSLILVTKASRLVSCNVRTNKTRHLGFQRSRLIPDCGAFRVYYYMESLVTITLLRHHIVDMLSSSS
ncbi:hypothetical protein FXO38_11848 [Capsicum annuum]|nr:hypothetical protein FXO38_11848 [Capsicum annuum]